MANEKVLLVDDEEDFTSLLKERLETRGLVVDAINNGAEAVVRARNERFDVVILDMQMPGMDGIETLRELLAIDPDLQVILLTGYGTIDKSVKAMKEGAADFLEKPPEIQALMDKIGKAAMKRTTLLEERKTEDILDALRKYGV